MNPLITAGASGILGMITGDRRENRQYHNNKKLMGIQMENQKKLNEQAQQLQMRTWEQTNYPAQMKMLKEAGLNPGLLYGKGGQGGTTGSVGGGTASSGSVQQGKGMDIGTAVQVGLMNAQKEKIEAETDNIKAQKETETQRGGLVMQQAIKTAEEIVNINRLNEIGENTKQDEIKYKQQKAIKEALENDLLKQKVTKTEEEINQIVNSIYRDWVNTGIKGVQAGAGLLIGGKSLETVGELLKKLKKARKNKNY
jgi:hypothetical protein